MRCYCSITSIEIQIKTQQTNAFLLIYFIVFAQRVNLGFYMDGIIEE